MLSAIEMRLKTCSQPSDNGQLMMTAAGILQKQFRRTVGFWQRMFRRRDHSFSFFLIKQPFCLFCESHN